MTKIGLRKVLNFLLLGGITSVMLIYLISNYFLKGTDIAQLPLIPMFLSQTFFFAIAFFTVAWLPKYIKEIFLKRHHLKTLEKAGLILQVLSIICVFSVFFLPFLTRFFWPAIILLLGIGIFLYYQTKSRISVTFISWAIGMPLLMYLSLTVFVYGTW